MEEESLSRDFVYWDPCCGRGNILSALSDYGCKFLFGTDLVDYGSEWQDYAGIDFLMEMNLGVAVDVILTNPPFKLAHEFVRRALMLCPNVVTLHRLAFYESERRSDILDSGMLKRVYCFRKRLPMMHRDNWQGPKTNSGMAFAWFVWDANYKGPTELRRISWR